MNIPSIGKKLDEIEKRLEEISGRIRYFNNAILPDNRLSQILPPGNPPSTPRGGEQSPHFAVRTSDALDALIELEGAIEAELARLERFINGDKNEVTNARP